MSAEHEQHPHGLSIEGIARIACETLLRDGAHAPMVIVEGTRQTVIAQIQELGGTHEERLTQMLAAGFSVGRQANIGEPEQVFFICEGWMSVAVKGKLLAVPPSQDPNRVEVLLVNQLVLEPKHMTVLGYAMLRNTDGKLVGVKRLPDFDDEKGKAENYLLDAFVEAFRKGRQVRNN